VGIWQLSGISEGKGGIRHGINEARATLLFPCIPFALILTLSIAPEVWHFFGLFGFFFFFGFHTLKF